MFIIKEVLQTEDAVTSAAVSAEHMGQSPDRPMNKKEVETVDIEKKE